MNLLGFIVLRSFWTSTALATALGEWLLVCACTRLAASPTVHLGGVAVLFALNRAACSWYEHERHRAPRRHALGYGLLAVGAAAISATAALAATRLAWLVVGALGGPSAEAGLTAVVATANGGLDVASGLAMAVAVGFVVHGYVRGWRRLEITHLEVTVPELPAAFDGFRLVHLSDLHVGPLCSAAALHEAFDAAMALAPDVVCVTGDLVDSRHADLAHWMPQLDRLDAPLGVLAILGNHDGYAGLEDVAEAVQRHTRWRLLRDDVATLTRGDARLHVAGLDHRPLPAAIAALPALVERVPADAPCILLAHHPGTMDSPAAARAALLLAGHTHGGQVAVPGAPRWNAARLLMTPWDRGTFRRDGTVLHVSRGVGTSGQRLRIGTPREITSITLRAAD